MKLPLALFSLSSMLSSFLLFIKNKSNSMNYFLYSKNVNKKQFITSDAALSELGLFIFFFSHKTFSFGFFFLCGQRKAMKFFSVYFSCFIRFRCGVWGCSNSIFSSTFVCLSQKLEIWFLEKFYAVFISFSWFLSSLLKMNPLLPIPNFEALILNLCLS